MLYPNKNLALKSRVGILGGGQLGRMLIMAGAGLGAHFTTWDADGSAPAMQLSSKKIIAPFDDDAALQEFLSSVDTVMIEWENIPTPLVDEIAKSKPIITSARVLQIAQSRLQEKNFFTNHAIPPAPFLSISSRDDATHLEKKILAAGITLPAILKTDRMGYDGKGQFAINSIEDILAVIKNPTVNPKDEFILEQKIHFVAEGSVLVARDFYGNMAAYPMVENQHRNGILDSTIFPAKKIPAALQTTAVDATKKMAESLNLQGLLCVEYFVTADNKLLANEMAPRPHNSFHWTIEGAAPSQFLQMARIALGLTVMPPRLVVNNITMRNILGEDINMVDNIANQENCFLHLYGKDAAKPGRKMGHYTIFS